MQTVTIYDGTEIPVMGLGTWTLGGRMQPDYSQDARGLTALRTALEIGYTHIDTAEMYADGHSEELVGQAIREVDRSQLFITTKVHPANSSYQRTLLSIDVSLKRLGIDMIDLYLIHWRGSVPLTETFRALNEAVRAGKIRHLGVSNFDLEDLRESQRLSETPIVTNQVPYSVASRQYVKNGVIPYCQEHGIVVTAYSPVEVGRLDVQRDLEQIATAHNATPYQIALAWLVQQPWVITIPMSHNPKHLQENWDAAAIALSSAEMARLDGLGS
jgi:diketogulonate reductase-like aldo/keto reductase